jgi:hypothetical protein
MVKMAARDYVRVQNRPAEANGHGKPTGATEEPPPPIDDDFAAYDEHEQAPF